MAYDETLASRVREILRAVEGFPPRMPPVILQSLLELLWRISVVTKEAFWTLTE